MPGWNDIDILVSNWCQTAPSTPVLPVNPINNRLSVYNLRFFRFHGMEEVIGSIPIRSTKPFNTLDHAADSSARCW
jgi:hypothetical protein